MIALLRRDARFLSARFGLSLSGLEAERANVKRRYGICYSDGSIRIRLRHATTGRLLKYSSLVDTLCHELAHLRHFNHGARFQLFYRRILEYARSSGVYRPTPRGRGQPGYLQPPAPPPAWPTVRRPQGSAVGPTSPVWRPGSRTDVIEVTSRLRSGPQTPSETGASIRERSTDRQVGQGEQLELF